MVILLCLILGGGTNQNLWSDHLLQLLMLPLMFSGLSNLFNNRLSGMSRIFAIFIIILLLMQFLPISMEKSFPQQMDQVSQWRLWSVSPSRSLEAGLFTISILGFSLFVARMSALQHKKLIRFIFLGFAINLLIGIIQLSYGSKVKVSDVLPFDIWSGMFANENHFSSLVYMVIPLIAWRVLVETWKPAVYFVIVGFIVLFQFSIGSRAGMAIAVLLALFSFVWIFLDRLPKNAKIAGLVGTVLIVAGWIAMIDSYSIQNDDDRLIIFSTTWVAIQQYLFTGTGLGSFVLVYPMFEMTKNVRFFYVNQAHNDYLQLLLELGLVFIPIALFYLFQIIRNMFRNKFSLYSGISIFAVLVHSIIDYPLRTMAIAVIFGALSAIILSEKNQIKR